MDSRIDHIGSLISRGDAAVLGEDGGNVARYRANVTSVMDMHGVRDHNLRSVVFNVGSLEIGNVSLYRGDAGERRIDLSFELSDLVRADVEGRVRKVNGQSGNWRYADFSSVIVCLAASLAYYRSYGHLSVDEIKGGDDRAVPLAVTSLRTQALDICADSGKVYIPDGVLDQGRPAVLTALLAAVTACGGHCVVDNLAVNPTNNSAIVPTAEGQSLAFGCYDALALLGRYYNANAQGSLYASLVAMGIHSVMTVHGHTDEGGFMRELIRRCRFTAPFGGMSVGVGDFAGLPRPDYTSGIAKLVDSLAIQTAGLVSLADPMVVHEGRTYPVTLVSGHVRSDAEEAALQAARTRDANIGTDGDAISNALQLKDVLHDFSLNWAKLCGRTMGVSGGESLVARLFCATHQVTSNIPYRHLKYEVVNPFQWVETTGSTKVGVDDMPCQQAGFGRLAAPREPGQKPLFEGLEIKGDTVSTTAIGVKWRGARVHGLLHHLQGHGQDGLANILPRALRTSLVVNHGHGARGVGGALPPVSSVGEKMTGERGLDAFLWGRGHSGLIAPGEFLYSGKTVGLLVRHVGGDLYNPHLNHVPSGDELKGMVEFTVTSLEAMGVARPSARHTAEDKRRRGAARALSDARMKLTMWRDPGALMPLELGEELEDMGAVEEAAEIRTPPGQPASDTSTGDGPTLVPTGVSSSTAVPRVPQGGARNVQFDQNVQAAPPGAV